MLLKTILTSFDISFKKSRVDPDFIELPDRSADDEDESSEPGDADEEGIFQQNVKSKVKAFSEHKISERGLLRLRNSILESMCKLNRLEAKGSKEELVGFLLDWVSANP